VLVIFCRESVNEAETQLETLRKENSHLESQVGFKPGSDLMHMTQVCAIPLL